LKKKVIPDCWQDCCEFRTVIYCGSEFY